MQEGDANQQSNQPPGGPFDAASSGPPHDAPPDEPSDAPPPPPDPGAPGGGSNLKLVVMSIIGLVLLAAAAVAAYAVLGLGGNTSEAPEIPPPTESGPSPSPSAALSPNQQVAVLEPLGAASGDVSGEAARSTAGGRFVLAVSAELPDPPEGSFYEVFLIHPVSQTQFSAGKLIKVGDRWVVTLDQARDASDYSQVIVTSESKDDGTPEDTVLTGQF